MSPEEKAVLHVLSEAKRETAEASVLEERTGFDSKQLVAVVSRLVDKGWATWADRFGRFHAASITRKGSAVLLSANA